MVFQDKTLVCSDCGATFAFSAGEQEFFQSKGSLSVARNPAEPIKHGVLRVAATATRHGIKSSAYLYPVLLIE